MTAILDIIAPPEPGELVALDWCQEPRCQGTAGHPCDHYEQTRWADGHFTTRFWPVIDWRGF